VPDRQALLALRVLLAPPAPRVRKALPGLLVLLVLRALPVMPGSQKRLPPALNMSAVKPVAPVMQKHLK
jgi:hypothetical protein